MAIPRRRKRTNNWSIKSKCLPKYVFRSLLILFVIVFIRNSFLLQSKLNSSFNDLDSKENENKEDTVTSASTAPVRYVTVVMPSVVNPKEQAKRLKAIAKTWGPAARAIFIVHDATQLPDFPILKKETVKYLFSENSFRSFPLLLPIPPSISEENGVERLKFVTQTITNLVHPEFSFFVNDHTYVIPEKLCHFLSRYDSNDHLYAGHALKNEKESYSFNSGAAGYVLSHHTMESLVQRWHDRDPQCDAPPEEKWLQNNPGLVTARCLHESLGVHPIDTRCPSKGHIFHAFGIVRTATGNVDPWYIKKHRGFDSLPYSDHFMKDYENVLSGEDCCSIDTISFHYVESYETLALYNLRQEIQQNPHMFESKLKTIIQETWPDNKKKGWVGGYGKPLPKSSETELWEAVVATFRKISDPFSSCHPVS